MLISRMIPVWVAVLVLGLSACKNDDDPSFAEADLTVAAGWSVSEAETDVDERAGELAAAVTEAELSAMGFSRVEFQIFIGILGAVVEDPQPCERDDVFTFKTDGSLGYSNAGTACMGTTTSIEGIFNGNTTWKLNGDQLTITDQDGTYVYTVLTLNDVELVIEERSVFEDPDLGFSTDKEVYVRYTFTAN